MTIDISARSTLKKKGAEYVLKFVLVGDSSVGKSQLLHRFSDDEYHPTPSETVGIEFSTKEISYYENVTLKVQVWDTSGKDRPLSLIKTYFSGAVGALLIYDVTNKESFDNIKEWLKKIKENAHRNIAVSLIATKVDRIEERVVSSAEGLHLADKFKMDYVETSAKTGENVQNAFRRLIMTVARLLPEGRYAEKKKQNSSPNRGLEMDLPSGWLQLDSHSKPGEFSYENIWTGERVNRVPSVVAKEYNSIKKHRLTRSLDLTGVGVHCELSSNQTKSNIGQLDQNCCIS